MLHELKSVNYLSRTIFEWHQMLFKYYNKRYYVNDIINALNNTICGEICGIHLYYNIQYISLKDFRNVQWRYNFIIIIFYIYKGNFMIPLFFRNLTLKQFDNWEWFSNSYTKHILSHSNILFYCFQYIFLLFGCN